ncbi:MAG TPA: ABC transporter permease, partial [Bacteroidetes bacterium]|nr:ABC transporter permease [Bacteroidota bacterium]
FQSFALAASEEFSRGCLVVGVDPDAENRLTNLAARVDSGSYFSAGVPGVLVADGLAKKLRLGLGDTLVMIGQGYHGASAAGKYPIVGMIHFGNPDLNTRMVYLTLKDAQIMYDAPERVSVLVLDLKSPNNAANVVAGIETRLGDQYEVMDWETMSPELVQMMKGDKGGNVLIIAILYLIVGFGIFGTVLMMTAERKYEFGVVVAIGMKRFKLALVVFMETIFVSILGILAGTVVSLPIVYYFNIYPIRIDSLAEVYAEFGFEPVLPTAIKAGIFMDQAIIVLVIAIVISIYPFQRILRLDPVSSMRG